MSSINTANTTDYSAYMHTYEAFRIPKGHEALNAKNAELIMAEDGGSELILTDEARKQMIKDRMKYSEAIIAEAQEAALKSQQEGIRQQGENMAKIMTVFRHMANGDIVPPSDEKKLMEYDDKLYQGAKMAQAIAIKAKRDKRKSEWNEKEEEENRERLKELGEKATELAQGLGQKSADFAHAQEGAVVEIDVSKVDLSSIQYFVPMTANIGGAVFDESI